MLYEFSDQINTREVLGPEKPRSAILPVSVPPIAPLPQQAQPLPTAIPARQGCVVAAMAVLFYIGLSSACRFSTALSEGNLFGGLANFGLSVLLFITAMGLFRMYRWAVNMVLIYCVVWSVEFLGTLLISLSIMNPHMSHAATKIIMYSMMAGFYLVALILPVFVCWWFWRRRRKFESHPIIESWGRSIYVLAIVIMMAGAVSNLVDANNTLPEKLEPQLEQLREIDRMW